MKAAQNSGKDIKYQLGYSNFTFELWIIVHKTDCNGVLWLGHSTFSTTADIYSHLDFHAQIESGLVMDGVFERNRVAEPIGLAAVN